MSNVKRFAQALLRQNYQLTNKYHRLRTHLQGMRHPQKIVIYQMGKVGSTTVEKSLEALDLNIPSYHIHTLDRAKLQQWIDTDRANFSKQRFIYTETFQSAYLRRQLDRGIAHPWNVITLVRDPLAKELSNFFQGLQRERLLGRDYDAAVAERGRVEVIDEIIDRFFTEYVPTRPHPFDWFNVELKGNLGFDIFAAPRLDDRGYRIYDSPPAKILLLKLEDLDRAYRSAFRDFLGLEVPQLIRANLGHDRPYKDLYQAFLRRIELPQSYLDFIYRSELTAHFYSEAEIASFRQKWQTKPAADGA